MYLEQEFHRALLRISQLLRVLANAIVVDSHPDKSQDLAGVEKYSYDLVILLHTLEKSTKLAHRSKLPLRLLLLLNGFNCKVEVLQCCDSKFSLLFVAERGFELL
jgi:hypothetical protein